MRRPFVFFTLLLGAALAAWLWPSLAGRKVLLPLDLLAHNPPHEPIADRPVHNPLIGDMLFESCQWKEFQRRALSVGQMPLWNPYTFCGHPLYTSGQSSTFYPFNFLFWVIPLPYAFAWFTWLHLLLGGVFTYLLFRRLGVGEFGAAVGGMCFAMGGFLVGRIVFPMLLASAIWLPLMLYWLDAMTEPEALKQRRHGLLLGPILFALPLLGGFFEIAFYAYMACGLFTLVRCLQIGLHARSAGTCAVFLAKAACAVVFALMLCAPQLLPFLEVMHQNVRAGKGDYRSALAAATQKRELLTTFIPDVLGNPAVHERFDPSSRSYKPIRSRSGDDHWYFGNKNYVEVCFYFGVLPLLFAVMSLRSPGRDRAFFWLLLGVGIAFALVTPVYKLFYYTVPGAEQVRTPFRWMYLSLFAGTYLAAIGADRWFERLRQPSPERSPVKAMVAALPPILALLVVVVLLLLPEPLEALASRMLRSDARAAAVFTGSGDLAGLLWANAARLTVLWMAGGALIAMAYVRRWSPRMAAGIGTAAIVLIAADLGQATFPFYTQASPAILKRTPPAIRRIQADRDTFRIGRYGPEKVLYANTPTLYGLQDYGGYDSIILKDYAAFVGAIERQNLLPYNIVMLLENPKSLDSPLLPLLNIRYLLTTKTLRHPDWEKLPVEGNVNLYRIRKERELPRAFMVRAARAVASLPEALDAIRSGGVNVFDEATVQVDATTVSGLTEPGGATGQASITDYRPGSVRVRTWSDKRQLLVLTDVHYPGWNAYVDGVRSELLIADGIFRGVSVPALGHEVEFRFEPRPLWIGSIVSLVCLAGLTLSAIHVRFTRARTAAASRKVDGSPPSGNNAAS